MEHVIINTDCQCETCVNPLPYEYRITSSESSMAQWCGLEEARGEMAAIARILDAMTPGQEITVKRVS